MRSSLAALVLLGGCSLQSGALLPDDASEKDAADAGVGDGGTSDAFLPDASPRDTGTEPDGTLFPDAGPVDATIDSTLDTEPACEPTTEACNAVDDDCDLEVDETGCACDRETFGDHVYLFCTSGLSFADAESACASWGYHLLFVETPEEQDFSWARASSRIVGDWWLGLSDRNVEGRYEWTDGTVVWEGGPVGYHAFRGGAPDDASGEDCFELDSSGGPWAGAGCDQSQPYVCESP